MAISAATAALAGCTGDGSEGGTTGSSTSSSTSNATTGSSTATSDGSTSSTGSTAGTSGSSGSITSSGSTGIVACEPSPADIEGPFYREGVPVGENLDIHGDNGVPLVLTGIVRDTACDPIANAVVELWHATPVAPGGQPGDADATYDDTQTYKYYGQVATDESGAYRFVTLRPGWYLNGAQYRPAHLHVKIWVGEQERLTTQLYFAGDPFADVDPWFNEEMALSPDAEGNATHDFTL